ncbi:hypothetical protein FF124_09100 [Martelella lutilitoris]|uniref:Sulfotransferase domain-containing protein n=1 Tax=Martelella lutilitoris TaxID=2583532 RepID=A0A5C4JTC3_9HYPH|nr:sulfotransferase domain-containing protein [Martelella lutilitoris]TNB48470.1 hypothetical protein FF124_09100 [Martelella lutilitoris]
MIIWLVSYPRSGNTLTRSVFRHYFNLRSLSIHGDQGDIGNNDELGELVGHQEGSRETINIESLRSDSEINLIKTHDCPNQDMKPEDIFIHILRDGRDSIVSYFHYLRDIVAKNEAQLADISLQDVISGQVPFGSWGNHTMMWQEFQAPKLFRFRFEEFRNDVPEFAATLAGIIGIKASTEPFPQIEMFQRAAPNFVRSGKIGGWREEFSEPDRVLFDMFNGFAMREAGYGGAELDEHEREAYSSFCRTMRSMEEETARSVAESRNLRTESDSLHETIFKLKSDLQKSDGRIRELGGKVDEKSLQIRSLESELSGRSRRIVAMDEELQEKTALIRENERRLDVMARELKAGADQIRSMEAELQERERQIRSLDEELRTANEKISFLEPKLKKYFRYLNRFKSAFGVRPHRLPWEK